MEILKIKEWVQTMNNHQFIIGFRGVSDNRIISATRISDRKVFFAGSTQGMCMDYAVFIEEFIDDCICVRLNVVNIKSSKLMDSDIFEINDIENVIKGYFKALEG